MINQRRDDGLLRFELDEAALRAIDKALGGVKRDTRKVLKKAVNDTAKQAQAKLADKAKETYVVKKGRFTKAMSLNKATTSKPVATIHITGEQLELYDFKASPTAYRTGSARPAVIKAKVKQSSSMKDLVKGKLKAFIVKFTNESKTGEKSNHTTIVQRKGKSRYPVKKLLSNSIPKMVGQEEVYGTVEPEIYDRLMVNIANEIQKVLDRK